MRGRDVGKTIRTDRWLINTAKKRTENKIKKESMQEKEKALEESPLILNTLRVGFKRGLPDSWRGNVSWLESSGGSWGGGLLERLDVLKKKVQLSHRGILPRNHGGGLNTGDSRRGGLDVGERMHG